MVASLGGNDASAVRALDAALRAAPGYAELDGWLGKTYLRLGERSVATGDSPKETAETFQRATAFALRAANRETRRDRLAYHARLRECLVRIGAQHLPSKQRYAEALEAAEKVLSVNELREQPAALALSGYCHFMLSQYDECIRRFQAVLDIVPEGEQHPWKLWREYSAAALADVKHWRSLEEKIVAFKGVSFDRQWTRDEGSGVRVKIEDGKVHFYGEARKDGRYATPSVVLSNDELFERQTLERVTLKLRIPRQDRRGDAINNVTFGVEVRSSRGGRSSKAPGIGIFYDKAKLAVRIGTGKIKRYKDGGLLRLDPEQMWPGDEEIEVRIEREDAEKGTMAVYLNDELVIRDNLSGFKRAKGKAILWIGGHATTAQLFDVWVSDISVVRRKE
jgi:tetratricopeptide (TPR) repeat protein